MSKFIPNSFQIANAIIDEFFSYLSGNEFKCYCYIARKTTGWNKPAEYLSITDLMTGCNLSKNAVISAIRELEDLSLICVQRKQVENAHKINKITINALPKISDEILQKISSKKQGGSSKNEQGGSSKNEQGSSKNELPTAPNTLISQGLQDPLNTLCTDIDKSISLKPTETKVSSETLLSEKKQEQKSFDKDFCVPPTSQSEVVANAQNSPCVSSDCEILPDEKTQAEEKIRQPEKQTLSDEQQQADIFTDEKNALSIVKPQKVISTITADTLIKQFGIDAQTAHDFMAVRKAKKAPLTYRALQGIEREAQKIGLTLEQALNICIERNWQGFQAHWLLKERNEVMQSMTDEQKEKEYKKACEYSHKLITALIEKGTIEDKDYHKWGFVFTGKFKECYSIQESRNHLMDAIQAEQTQQTQTAIGA